MRYIGVDRDPYVRTLRRTRRNSLTLSLLIVLRYSTVVVLVVEVVVVVLEVVSASSQQRPVTQSVSPVVVVQHFSLFLTD